MTINMRRYWYFLANFLTALRQHTDELWNNCKNYKRISFIYLNFFFPSRHQNQVNKKRPILFCRSNKWKDNITESNESRYPKESWRKCRFLFVTLGLNYVIVNVLFSSCLPKFGLSHRSIRIPFLRIEHEKELVCAWIVLYESV